MAIDMVHHDPPCLCRRPRPSFSIAGFHSLSHVFSHTQHRSLCRDSPPIRSGIRSSRLAYYSLHIESGSVGCNILSLISSAFLTSFMLSPCLVSDTNQESDRPKQSHLFLFLHVDKLNKHSQNFYAPKPNTDIGRNSQLLWFSCSLPFCVICDPERYQEWYKKTYGCYDIRNPQSN